jgi:hypothetical protein
MCDGRQGRMINELFVVVGGSVVAVVVAAPSLLRNKKSRNIYSVA